MNLDFLKSKNFFIFIAVIFAVKIIFAPHPFATIGYPTVPINALIDPIQTPAVNVLPKKIQEGDKSFTITPVQNYEVSAQVVSKCNYWYGWDARLIPVDLALAWGDLIKDDAGKHISYWQYGRWYYYRYNGDAPWDSGYVATHSSNHHIIPANKNVHEAVKSIKKNDIVKLIGYLVNVDMVSNSGQKRSIASSQSRSDTGGGSCEVMYVKKIQIGDKLFE